MTRLLCPLWDAFIWAQKVLLWHVQIPRLYDIYKAQGLIDNFEQLLDNIFQPLFEVTVDPNSHPQLHLFLKQVLAPGVSLPCLQCSVTPPLSTRTYPRP